MNYALISIVTFIGVAGIVAYATHDPPCLSRGEIDQAIYKAPLDATGLPAEPTLVMGSRTQSCVTAVEFRQGRRP